MSLTAEPNISGYVENADTRALRLDVGPVSIWYSYTTIVAFRVLGGRTIVRTNDWSRTTGRHLNAIDGGGADAKKSRIGDDEFQKLWNMYVSPILQIAQVEATRFYDSEQFAPVRRRLDRGINQEAV